MVTFKEYAKKALVLSINESISSRLKSALSINETIEKTEENKVVPINEPSENKIITTEEEIEAFQIVKAILRERIPSSRIAARDTQSYFGVLLDDNNRKPICRFHFNTANKYLETFAKGKDAGEKVLIDSPDEIYQYRGQLHQTLDQYQ